MVIGRAVTKNTVVFSEISVDTGYWIHIKCGSVTPRHYDAHLEEGSFHSSVNLVHYLSSVRISLMMLILRLISNMNYCLILRCLEEIT